MSPLFGKKKKRKGMTIAVLDVENGSVASALVRITQREQPKLFAQHRITLPILRSTTSGDLARTMFTASEDALLYVAEVAARLRTHIPDSSAGAVTQVAIFLHAPWTTMVTTKDGGCMSDTPESLLEQFRNIAEQTFGSVPVSFHAFGTTAVPMLHKLFDDTSNALTVSLTGEVTELFLTNNNRLVGHATTPTGLHTLVRTLETHGGLTQQEARSALTLMDGERPLNASWKEAFSTGTDFLLREIHDAAHTLVPTAIPQHIFVLAPEKNSTWLARVLAKDNTLGELFPDGATVRDIKSQHILPYIAAHPTVPDTSLMLESLCVNSRFGIY